MDEALDIGGVVGSHLHGPGTAVVRCAGGKSQVEALDRTASVRPIMPSPPERQAHDHVGTTTRSPHS